MRESPEYAEWQHGGVQTLERIIQEKNARYENNPRLFSQSGVPLVIEFDSK